MIKRYFLGVITEMKRVRWPKMKDLMIAFVTVLIFGTFFALFLFGFDWFVMQMLKAVGAN